MQIFLAAAPQERQLGIEDFNCPGTRMLVGGL
jgi:hypothetical protein